MKILISSTLLLTLAFLAMPLSSQAQDKKYKDIYKEVNKPEGSPKVITTAKGIGADMQKAKITGAQLDSLMNNVVSTAPIKGKTSLKHPVLILDSNTKSAAAESLFGCCDEKMTDSRGQGEPTPKISGSPVVKKSLAGTTTIATLTGSAGSPNPSATGQPGDKTSTSQPAKQTTNPFQHLSNSSSSGLVRSMNDVSLVDASDEVLLKKYSIVVGSFRQYNNANFVKRTFNGLGERPFIVKKSDGIHYVVVASCSTENEAIEKLDEFTKKYAANLSKSKRVSKYGIPLDDMWILTF